MRLPFDESLISRNRFHGLIQGQFTEHNKKFYLPQNLDSLDCIPEKKSSFTTQYIELVGNLKKILLLRLMFMAILEPMR